MENKDVSGRKGPSRRVILSASAVTARAAATPIVSGAASANAASIHKGSSLPHHIHDKKELRAALAEIDPNRIKTIITTLAAFGTRHTASSQTDPNRGIGAAIPYVTGLMNDIAAASGGRMTVQQQTFTQPVSSTIPVPTSITNIIATIKGTATPERFYVVTGHLDSRCTHVLDFTSDAPEIGRA